MNLLELLKEKPEVQHNLGVKVILALPTEENKTNVGDKTKPLITAEKDDGKRAKDILEKIKQKKLTSVIKKFPEPIEDIVPSKAPVIEEEEIIKPKKIHI